MERTAGCLVRSTHPTFPIPWTYLEPFFCQLRPNPVQIRLAERRLQRLPVFDRAGIAAALIGQRKDFGQIDPHIRIRSLQRNRDAGQFLLYGPGIDLAVGSLIGTSHEREELSRWQITPKWQSLS